MHMSSSYLEDKDLGSMTTKNLDQLLTKTQAADLICYSPRALQNWRLRGGGPPYIKVSARSIRYQRRDILN